MVRADRQRRAGGPGAPRRSARDRQAGKARRGARLPEARGGGQPRPGSAADRCRGAAAARGEPQPRRLRAARPGAAEGSRAARPALRHGADRREARALRADGIEPAQADRGAARARARLQRARLLLRRAQHAAGRGEKADRKSARALAGGLFHHRQPGLGALPRGQSEGRGGAAAPRLQRAARRRDRRAPRRSALGDGPARRGRAHLAGVDQVRAGKRHAAEDDQALQAVMATALRRSAAYALATLVLGGCAQLETRPARETEFDLAGRLAARHGEESFTGNIAWRHAEDFDEMLITTPLGQGVARIVREGDQVALTTAEPREYHAADVESLTQQVLGFRLPLDGLADWVRGRPSPDLERRGWKIEYQEYAGELPARLRLLYPGIELRLIISRWK